VTGISTPLVLSQNQSSTFNVTFAPSSAGAVSGNVYLTNNGSVTSVTIPVTGTGTTAASHEVVLEWTASSSAVLGYNTYRSTVSGGPYAKLTASPSPATIYDDQNVQAGDTYYYVVTSVGTDSVESGYSNQASATVPSS
jgi:fibronectin type 3 domain-containing protein